MNGLRPTVGIEFDDKYTISFEQFVSYMKNGGIK